MHSPGDSGEAVLEPEHFGGTPGYALTPALEQSATRRRDGNRPKVMHSHIFFYDATPHVIGVHKERQVGSGVVSIRGRLCERELGLEVRQNLDRRGQPHAVILAKPPDSGCQGGYTIRPK